MRIIIARGITKDVDIDACVNKWIYLHRYLFDREITVTGRFHGKDLNVADLLQVWLSCWKTKSTVIVYSDPNLFKHPQIGPLTDLALEFKSQNYRCLYHRDICGLNLTDEGWHKWPEFRASQETTGFYNELYGITNYDRLSAYWRKRLLNEWVEQQESEHRDAMYIIYRYYFPRWDGDWKTLHIHERKLLDSVLK